MIFDTSNAKNGMVFGEYCNGTAIKQHTEKSFHIRSLSISTSHLFLSPLSS